MQQNCVLMLEDSRERLERFTRVLTEIAPEWVLRHWRAAPAMIRECGPYLPCCGLICLDHDLNPLSGSTEDPGDGLEVARHLATLRPACPILIHSSNGEGATRMLGEFQLGGWEAYTILPLGEGWIERYWRGRVVELLSRRME